MNEKTKIGANSATLISEIAYGSLLVLSATYRRIAKLRTQIPICRSTLDNKIVCRNRLRRRLGAWVLVSCLFNLFNLQFVYKNASLSSGMSLLSNPYYTDLIIVDLLLKTEFTYSIFESTYDVKYHFIQPKKAPQIAALHTD